MSLVPQPERTISIMYERVDTWPSHCPTGCSNCVQCWISGKVRCSPRFWLGGLYGFYFYRPKPVSTDDLEERRHLWRQLGKDEDRYGHYVDVKPRAITLRKEGKSAPAIASILKLEFGLDIYTRTILKWVKDIPYTDQSNHNRGDTTAQRLRAIELRQQHYTIAAIAGKLRHEYRETFSISTIYLWTKDVLPEKRVHRQPVASIA